MYFLRQGRFCIDWLRNATLEHIRYAQLSTNDFVILSIKFKQIIFLHQFIKNWFDAAEVLRSRTNILSRKLAAHDFPLTAHWYMQAISPTASSNWRKVDLSTTRAPPSGEVESPIRLSISAVCWHFASYDQFQVKRVWNQPWMLGHKEGWDPNWQLGLVGS